MRQGLGEAAGAVLDALRSTVAAPQGADPSTTRLSATAPGPGTRDHGKCFLRWGAHPSRLLVPLGVGARSWVGMGQCLPTWGSPTLGGFQISGTPKGRVGGYVFAPTVARHGVGSQQQQRTWARSECRRAPAGSRPETQSHSWWVSSKRSPWVGSCSTCRQCVQGFSSWPGAPRPQA